MKTTPVETEKSQNVTTTKNPNPSGWRTARAHCLIAVCLLSGARAFGLDLPAATDIPAAPPSVASPGGLALPNLTGDPQPGAPAIAAGTQITFPGETLAVTGNNLTDAGLVVWAEGRTFLVEPLRSAQDRVQAVIPLRALSVLTGTTGTVPQSCMLAWPVSLSGGLYGRPLRINGPSDLWMWPKRKWLDNSDREIRLYGKNLKIGAATPTVYVQHENDTPVAATVTASNPYEVRATLPAGYSTGAWKAWVHNGTGGAYGWSPSADFTVQTFPYNQNTLFVVDNYTGTDQQKIQAAITAAQNNNGGTVVFAARTYEMTAGITVSKPVILLGAGMGGFDPLTETTSGNGTVLRSPPNGGGSIGTMVSLTGAGSGIKNMTIQNRAIGNSYGVGFSSTDQTLDSARVIASRSPLGLSYQVFDASDPIMNLRVLNSEIFFRVEGINSGYGQQQVMISGCKFMGAFTGEITGTSTPANNAIYLRGVSDVIVENSSFGSVDPLGEHGNVRVLTRSILSYCSGAHNQHICGNTATWVGAFPGLIAGRDTNTGEQFLFHSMGNRLTASVVSSSNSTITVNRPIADFQNLVPYFNQGFNNKIAQRYVSVFLPSGPGLGQFRAITAITANGTSNTNLVLAEPLRVQPTAADTVAISQLFFNNNVYGNVVDAVPDPAHYQSVVGAAPDFTRLGMAVWFDDYNSAFASNTIRHCLLGMYIGSYIDASGWSPAGWLTIRDNLFSDMVGTGPYYAAGDRLFYQHDFSETNPAAIGSAPNVFRNNTGSGAEQAARVKTHNISGSFVPGAGKGFLMDIIENNSFDNLSTSSVAIGGPANWPLVRNNTIPASINTVTWLNKSQCFEPWAISRLAARWMFEGNAADLERGLDGSLTGNATYGTGIIGQCVDLHQVGEYVNAGDRPSLNFAGDSSFSVSAWIKTSGAYSPIVGKYYYSWDQGWEFMIYASKLIFTLGKNTAEVDANFAPYLNNAWHHVVAVKSSTALMRLYIDGVEATYTKQQNGVSVNTNTRPLLIGARNDSTNSNLIGSIDDVRIYSQALTADEVLQLYSQE